MQERNQQQAARPKATVFYDGGCPLCRREIGFYRSRRGGEQISWIDVSQADEDEQVAPGLCTEAALARFHLRDEEGRIIRGGRAFAHLWSLLPGFRPFGRLLLLPPLSWLLDPAYDVFLKFRPGLQRLMARP